MLSQNAIKSKTTKNLNRGSGKGQIFKYFFRRNIMPKLNMLLEATVVQFENCFTFYGHVTIRLPRYIFLTHADKSIRTESKLTYILGQCLARFASLQNSFHFLVYGYLQSILRVGKKSLRNLLNYVPDLTQDIQREKGQHKKTPSKIPPATAR